MTTAMTRKTSLENKHLLNYDHLIIRPVARKDYGTIAHEAKPSGILSRGPWVIMLSRSVTKLANASWRNIKLQFFTVKYADLWGCFCPRRRACLKCSWQEIFYYLIGKSIQNDEEWRLFYCDSTLGCWVIQDFNLCKLDECDVITGTVVQNHKILNISHDFFCIELKLSTVVILLTTFNEIFFVTLPWQQNGFKVENQSFPPSRSVICSCCSFSGCERIWTLQSTSTR